MRTRLILALAIVGTLLFAGSAAARDVNRDRIPDRWEKRHGLSLKVDQAKRDQDDDGFKNRAEWRAKTDPRNEDTDGDGVPDADENAGTVTSYADGVLTVTLFDGGELSGAVDEDTRITCGSTDEMAAKPSAHDPGDDDPAGAGAATTTGATTTRTTTTVTGTTTATAAATTTATATTRSATTPRSWRAQRSRRRR